MRELATLEELAEAGQQALADEPAARRERVDEFHRWASWWRETFERACEEWHASNARAQEPASE